MAIDQAELEQLPPVGHVKLVYLGPTSPHWEVHGVFGDGRLIDEFRQRALARLQLLPPHDPQFRRNRERVNRDAERVVFMATGEHPVHHSDREEVAGEIH